ncbi:MAG: hypothetical protein V7703_20430 [Hyphomicrobiales bacterium]
MFGNSGALIDVEAIPWAETAYKTKVHHDFGGFFLKDGAACGMTGPMDAQTNEASAHESG